MYTTDHYRWCRQYIDATNANNQSCTTTIDIFIARTDYNYNDNDNNDNDNTTLYSDRQWHSSISVINWRFNVGITEQFAGIGTGRRCQ
jgi:hypothetical protein